MAPFGSDLEWSATQKRQAVKREPAWNGVGQKVGTQIWRIDKSKVTNWPKVEHGTFFSHDTYIILNTQKKHGHHEMLYDVHLWIGKYSTQQEYMTAIQKIVQLATLLDPVQHREVMDHESDLFRSYFDTIVYLEGGADTGFHHAKPTEYLPRLLLLRGSMKNCIVREVPLNVHSLDSSHVFILDLGLTFYIWCGKRSKAVEETEAIQYVQKLKSDRAGLVSSVKLRILWNEELSRNFMATLNHDVLDKEEEEDANDYHFLPCVMRLSNQPGTMTPSLGNKGHLPIPKTCFDSQSVFIIDTGNCLYVWSGDRASHKEKKNGLTYAHNYLMTTKHPLIPVSCYVQGKESDEFWKAVS